MALQTVWELGLCASMHITIEVWWSNHDNNVASYSDTRSLSYIIDSM